MCVGMSWVELSAFISYFRQTSLKSGLVWMTYTICIVVDIVDIVDIFVARWFDRHCLSSPKKNLPQSVRRREWWMRLDVLRADYLSTSFFGSGSGSGLCNNTSTFTISCVCVPNLSLVKTTRCTYLWRPSSFTTKKTTCFFLYTSTTGKKVEISTCVGEIWLSCVFFWMDGLKWRGGCRRRIYVKFSLSLSLSH